MGSEVLDEKIEWEARRVATAFEVKEWRVEIIDEGMIGLSSVGDEKWQLNWAIDSENTTWYGVQIIGQDGENSATYDENWSYPRAEPTALWNCHFVSPFNEAMARGLYRLGFEDEQVLAELNIPLSAHEKLELRLSMPREFWPQKWLDEEADFGDATKGAK